MYVIMDCIKNECFSDHSSAIDVCFAFLLRLLPSQLLPQQLYESYVFHFVHPYGPHVHQLENLPHHFFLPDASLGLI